MTEEPHRVVIGNSAENKDFPKNKHGTSYIQYIWLLLQVVRVEVNTFYSLYFILLAILQLLPADISSTSAAGTLVPLIAYIAFSYILQAIDYTKTVRSNFTSENTTYNIIRDHQILTAIKSKNICPGDVIIMEDDQPIPCDCVLLTAENISIYVDTSTLDGETDPKDKFPISMPSLFNESYITVSNSTITATNPKNPTTNVNGEFHWSKSDSIIRSPSLETASTESGNKRSYRMEENGDITTTFDSTNFVERGVKIVSSGRSLLVALYTGSHCRSGNTKQQFVARHTLVDSYVEKISILVFLIQFTISVILGVLGYAKLARENPPGAPETYTGIIDVYGKGTFYVAVVIITRNFLLLSFMVPITLKLILPIFRCFYGIFIANDLNFYDDVSGATAQALNTNITENLGAIDAIVTDKTGTLTKNQLQLIAVAVGEDRYGDGNGKAATIFEDDTLSQKLKNPEGDENFIQIFRALSICHSVRVNDEQKFFGSSHDELAILEALVKLGWNFANKGDTFTAESPFGTTIFKVLRVIPFNRDRMRMSIVVQDDTGIYVYMKGAAESIVRKCTTFSGSTAAEFDQYERRGLRALCVSMKRLEEYDPSEPDSSLEGNHHYLGTIGIEDALQQDVQLSVEMLQGAGLKIWVATGDSHRNTIVTAAKLKLLNKDEDTIVQLRVADLAHNLRDFSARAMMVPEGKFTVLLDCDHAQYISSALQDEEFVNALFRARCVIFYRCRPATKAAAVTALQMTGRRVLAVGDGANDTNLLRNADVGVGMLQQDGRASFAACDFAVPSFRAICRLILVHGHTSLHRSMLAVHFSFYKAMQFGVVQAIYQAWTGFSGQSFFGSLSLSTFNLIWTLLPMLAVLFEKDVSENFLFRLSSLYKKLRSPFDVKPSTLTWLYVAVYQGAMTMFVAYMLTGEAFMSNGKELGRDYLSIIVYLAQVITVTFYLMYNLNTLTYYSLILLIGNMLLMVAFSGIFQASWMIDNFGVGREWQGFFGECFNNLESILLLTTIVLACITPSWLGLSLWSYFRSTESLLVIEKETIAAKNDTPLFFDPPKAK